MEKLKFLQLNRHDLRIEFLITCLNQKTENMKIVVDI